MTREYRTEHHDSRAGLAAMMRRKQLSNRALRLLIGMLGEADADGVFSRHLSYACDWTQQSDDTARHALRELVRCGLICRHPVLPRAFCLDPSLWYNGSTRQLSRHVRLFERQRHGLPPEPEALH